MKHNVNLSEKDVKEYHTELSVLAGMLTFWGTACGLLVLVAVTIMQIYLSGFILSIGTFFMLFTTYDILYNFCIEITLS